MTNNEQKLLPFDEIKRKLRAVCSDGLTGDLCLFTEDKHTAVISIHNGDIVGLRYRIARGANALRLIRSINSASVRFQKGEPAINKDTASTTPSTKEVLNLMEVAPKVEVKCLKKKILVVEDSQTQRKVICRMLSQNGFQVAQANDGYDALAQLNELQPDLILLDIVMPGIDGYKVMSLIKKMPDMKNTPVIMLTSRDGLIDKMRGKVSGTNEYLTKPFNYEELIEKIDKYVLV